MKNLANFPKLKEQVDYLQDLQNLVILLNNRMEIASEDNSADPKIINDNKILIIKTKLEIEGVERNIAKKKATCETMEETLDACLKEMESSYDGLVERTMASDSDALKNLIGEIKTEEDKVAVYLEMKQAFAKVDGDVKQLNSLH